MLKYMNFDTEFKNSMNKNLTVVCSCLQDHLGNKYTYWMDEIDRFKKDFETWVNEGYMFFTYMATAEYRFLLSIGFNREFLKSVKMVDIYPMWRIILYGPSKYKFGKYVYSENGKTKITVTQAPKKGQPYDGMEYEDAEGNEYTFNDIKTRMYNPSLVHACCSLLNVIIDSAYKDKIRDIILTEDDLTMYKDDIIKYCLSDVKYLYKLAVKCQEIIKKYNKKFCIQDVLKMSEWMLDVACIESTGIPVNKERILNFSSHIPNLIKELPERCNNIQAFFKWNEKQNKYIRNYELFEKFIITSGIKWPKTEKGKYKQDKKTLHNFKESFPEIAEYAKTIVQLRELSYFDSKRVCKILNNISTEDGYLRCGLMPYGSQTSRCQPRPTDGYIFLMSRWIRNVIDDKKVIIGGDYSAQETYIAGELSKDKAFHECYMAGDPYVWFAKKTGNIPRDVERKGGFFYTNKEKLSVELQEKYTTIRYLFKSLMLGVGYGMGEDSLALSLTATAIASLPENDRKDVLAGKNPKLLNKIRVVGKDEKDRFPSRQRADYYINLHREIFKIYNIWRKNIYETYKHTGCLKLKDGWCLIGYEGNMTSVTNFPVQGTGQVYLRKAVANALDCGLKVITTLHDAIYIESTEETKEEDIKKLYDCMTREKPEIRVDIHEQLIDWDNFTSNWSDEKGAKEFKDFGKYFLKNNNNK
jgi:hypothetical protein